MIKDKNKSSPTAKSLNTISRFRGDFSFAGMGFFINFAIIYILIFVSLYPIIGLRVVVMSPLIVVIAGWFWGMRGGLIAGLFCFPLNVLLSKFIGDTNWDVLFWSGNIIGFAASILLGAWTGHMFDLSDKLKQEFSVRLKAEVKLKEYSKKLEKTIEQLRSAQYQLIIKERLATLGRLSGSIAHEIKNPLSVIDSSVYYLQNLKLKDADEDTQLHLDRIKGEVSDSISIIQSLLDLTKMKEPEKNNIDIANVIKNDVDTIEIPRSIKKIINVPDGKFFVDVDNTQLFMVFKNIVTNAVQAMEKKGTLWVNLKKIKNDWIEVTFRDSGAGIAPENMKNIFQPLFSTKAKGIGFGLSICRMIIEKFGGTIEVQSKVGEGASFIIRLPCVNNITTENDVQRVFNVNENVVI
jgi:signal transduction histidine kinase